MFLPLLSTVSIECYLPTYIVHGNFKMLPTYLYCKQKVKKITYLCYQQKVKFFTYLCVQLMPLLIQGYPYRTYYDI